MAAEHSTSVTSAEQSPLPPLPITEGREYRHIPGLFGYCASDYGEILRWRHVPRKWDRRCTWLDTRGYETILIGGIGKRRAYLIHRLVLEAFVGPRPEGMECRHLNGCKTDNRLPNLAWGTHTENMRDLLEHGRRGGLSPRNGAQWAHCYGMSPKLTPEDVREIRRLIHEGNTFRAVAAKFGIKCSTVSAIITGKTWRHV